MSGEVSPDKFVNMSDDDLKSEDQRKKDVELEKENMKKAQVPMAEKSISDSLECGRCKQKKVSYTQAQTRAADEPMTTFCECMACGHRWKVCIIISVVNEMMHGSDMFATVLIKRTGFGGEGTSLRRQLWLMCDTIRGKWEFGVRSGDLKHVPRRKDSGAHDTFHYDGLIEIFLYFLTSAKQEDFPGNQIGFGD